MSLDELRAPRKRVVVYHASYGCETGCCGHYIEVDDESVGHWTFSHPDVRAGDDPDAAFREFAREFITERLGAEHVADIDWDNCGIFDD